MNAKIAYPEVYLFGDLDSANKNIADVAPPETTIPPSLDWFPGSGSFASLRGPTPSFSRASGATMVDVTGKVVLGPENLLVQSGDLTSASWSKGGVVVTPSQIDPDGGNTAFLLSPNTANSNLMQTFTPNAVLPLTASIWLKSATGTNVSVSLLLNSMAGTDTLAITVTPVWQRFSVTGTTLSSSGAVNFYIGEFSTWSTGENILAWHPQAERSSVARPYILTTSAPVYGPRITYDPITHKCLGYLAEEQRTNHCPYSETLDDISWVPRGTTVVAPNALTSPSGAMTGDQVTLGVRGTNDIYNLFPVPSRSTCVVSFWIKKISGTGTLHVVNSALITLGQYDINLSMLGSGWERIFPGHPAVTVVIPFVDSSSQMGLNIGSDAATCVLGLWGMQVEGAAFNLSTSYIPTTSAAVTRAADVCSINGTDFASFYNQPEGSFITHSEVQGMNGIRVMMSVADVDDMARLIVYDAVIAIEVYTFGVLQFGGNLGSIAFLNDELKLGYGYKTNDFVIIRDGSTLLQDTIGDPNLANKLEIGAQGGTYIFTGTISRIQYYPKRLPNSKLIELTQP